MARGLNKVMLIGNVGADPEMRYLPSGSAVANVSLATSSSWKDKTSGEQQERTEWHRITFFNRLAEVVGEYVRKGSKLYIEGNIRYRKWTDNDGVERWSTDIHANEMQMLDSRGDAGGFSSAPSQDFGQPMGGSNQQFGQSGGAAKGGQAPAAGAKGPAETAAAGDFDDEIPF